MGGGIRGEAVNGGAVLGGGGAGGGGDCSSRIIPIINIMQG